MTREEERQIAAEQAYPYVGGIKGIICENSIPIFVQGAEWTDEHPRKGMVDIEKVCEFVLNNLHHYVEYSKVTDGIVCYNYKFSEDLRKAMEE